MRFELPSDEEEGLDEEYEQELGLAAGDGSIEI